jgi:hypothetical protein
MACHQTKGTNTMKTTIDFSDFREAFRNHDRDNSYTREGLMMLFEYFEQYEEETGQEIELDVIAICCDYDENHWEDVASNYRIDLTDCEDEDDKIEAVRDYLTNNTSLVGEPLAGTFLYVAF